MLNAARRFRHCAEQAALQKEINNKVRLRGMCRRVPVRTMVARCRLTCTS